MHVNDFYNSDISIHIQNFLTESIKYYHIFINLKTHNPVAGCLVIFFMTDPGERSSIMGKDSTKSRPIQYYTSQIIFIAFFYLQRYLSCHSPYYGMLQDGSGTLQFSLQATCIQASSFPYEKGHLLVVSHPVMACSGPRFCFTYCIS